MKFLKKLLRLVAGTANDALDSAADAGRDLRQIIRELDSRIEKAESAVLDVDATYEMLRGKQDAAEAEANKWAESAKKAVAAHREDLARECLTKKSDFARTAALIGEQVATLDSSRGKQKAALESLRRKRRELEQRADLLAARDRIATAQEVAAEVLGGIGQDALGKDFETVEEQVIRHEGRARAAANMADDKTGGGLEAELAALGDSDDIEAELAALQQEVATAKS